jgi:hypothetical protein
MELEIKEFDQVLKVMNIYGPYADRRPFWEMLALSGAHEGPYVIIGGNLNLNLSLI